MLSIVPETSGKFFEDGKFLIVGTEGSKETEDLFGEGNTEPLNRDGYVIRSLKGEGGECERISIIGKTDRGALYGVFHFLRLLQLNEPVDTLDLLENPKNEVRMIDHWDNIDGTIERGYAGNSIFFRDGRVSYDPKRIEDYARLLSSVGINAVSLNNVNVHEEEMFLITGKYLPRIARIAAIFRRYGIRIFLSVNFASPTRVGKLLTSDPLDESVKKWWSDRAGEIYGHITDFGGFLIKADSEYTSGPFAYNRTHADGANALADALAPFGGLLIWRAFVYTMQDWRDRETDRAKAAYDFFGPLDGKFRDNVVLQIKNGPVDFQVREPVSPLFGTLSETNQILELQITQEYTGQQRDLCYLVPQWKEVLGFDTQAEGKGSTVAEVAAGTLFGRPHGGISGVSNVGDDLNWTGHILAQANLYGFGRLAWNPLLASDEITTEWVVSTFGNDPFVVRTVSEMLSDSWPIYESYTAPLGVGWMVTPSVHYGPSVDGYEYSKWGTYHYADREGIGVDRTVKTGTGFTAQYHSAIFELYESVESCPDELLLFFHHLPYTHRLKSGKTVIQHIYDSHFEGFEKVAELRKKWMSLKEFVDPGRFGQVLERFDLQISNAREWRDEINSYFFRKSGIEDEMNREIY